MAFGSVAFGTSALNNVFVTYYVELFTSVARLTPTAFYIGQVIFMIWNACNDPLLGWLSDTMPLPAFVRDPFNACNWRHGGSGAHPATVSSVEKRAAAIRFGGVLWAFSFVFVWWPWAHTDDEGSSAGDGAFVSPALSAGFHFALSLVLYDGFLTYTEVNADALLAEMTGSERERAEANAWGAVWSMLGSLTSLAAHIAWSHGADAAPSASGGGGGALASLATRLLSFRAFTAVLAVLAAASFIAATHVLIAMDAAASARPVAKELGDAIERGSDASALFSVSGDGDSDGGRIGGTELGTATGARPQLESKWAVGGGSHEGRVSRATHRAAHPTAAVSVAPHSVASLPERATQTRMQLAKGEGDVATPQLALLAESPVVASSTMTSRPVRLSFTTFLRQLLESPNLRIFAIVATLQQFDCTFEKNFFAPFLEALVLTAAVGGAGGPSPAARATVITLSFLLPHAATLAWTPWVTALGIKTTLQRLFGLRLALIAAAVAVAAASAAPRLAMGLISGRGGDSGSGVDALLPAPPRGALGGWFIAAVLLVNRVLSESACRLFPLARADIIDEDARLHKRPAPVSAALVGAVGFTGKAAQSLAPMLAYALLSGGDSVPGAAPAAAAATRIWTLLIAVPAVCVCLQLAAWRGYTLDGVGRKVGGAM